MLAQNSQSVAQRPWGMFLILSVIGFAISMGYGIVRYQSDLINLSDVEFIEKWNADALEHVLIARALLSGKGYVVDDLPQMEGKHVRAVGQEALFKAPFYQFFLAGLFALSGFSFALFFPVQCLLQGFLSGFVGLIALETFERPAVAWFAGVATAANPVLVNIASQPYNENVFFFLLFAALWTFIRWLGTADLRWAIACGILGALSVLTRESAFPLFAAMVIVGALTSRRTASGMRHIATMALVFAMVIAPWSVRNYLKLGVIVPVASALGHSLVIGNNECTASESFLSPFWGEGPCAATTQRRAQLLAQRRSPGSDNVVYRDRMDARIALQFIITNPLAYLKLSFRRMWTVFLPYNPRAEQRLVQRGAFAVYWLMILPVGLISALIHTRKPQMLPRLLALLIVTNLSMFAAVYFSPDLRYRVGMDLLLACFAGWGYSHLLDRWSQRDLGIST